MAVYHWMLLWAIILPAVTSQCDLTVCLNITAVNDDGTFLPVDDCTVRRSKDNVTFPLIGHNNIGQLVICVNDGLCVDTNEIDDSFMLPENTGVIIDSGLIPFSLVILLTYLMYTSLHTIPGILLINLELAYILFHITFIIFHSIELSGDDPGATCTVTSLAGLYTLAAIGTWKNIFLQYTCWVFYKSSKLQSAIPDKKGKIILILTVIGWALPMVITMAIFSIDFIDRREFLYDTENCVHILDEPAFGVGKLLAIIYIGIQNIYNVILFVIIIVLFLQALHDSDQEVSKQSGLKTKLLKVSFTLLVVTGVSWIFSLISAYTNARWIRGLAITVKVTEQLLLFVLLTLTKTVLKLYLNSIRNVLQKLRTFFMHKL